MREAVDESIEDVVQWTHTHRRGTSPYRANVFGRERGVVYAKLLDGRPPDPRGVVVFGLDAEGRSRIETEYAGDGRLVWQTVARYEGPSRTYVTYGLNSKGAWAAEYVSIEQWEGERPLSVVTLSAIEPGITREDYRYEDGRVVVITESREWAMGDGSHQRSWRVEYSEDGKPAALLSDGEVVWRRRARSAEFGRTLRNAEQLLVTAVRGALVEAGVADGLVVLLHQDDGAWSDQALPQIAVPSPAHVAEPPERWFPTEWPTVAMAPGTQSQVEEALDRLDAYGLPRDDEAAVFLRVVARRVRAISRHARGAEIRIVVSTHDPPDLLHDIRRAE